MTGDAIQDLSPGNWPREVEEGDPVRAPAASIASKNSPALCWIGLMTKWHRWKNPTLLFQEGQFGLSKYKMTGYAIPDDGERLLLVATVYTGELPPRALDRYRHHRCLRTSYSNSTSAAARDCTNRLSRRTPMRAILPAASTKTATKLNVVGFSSSQTVWPASAPSTTSLLRMANVSSLTCLALNAFSAFSAKASCAMTLLWILAAELGAPLTCIKVSGNGADYDAYLGAIPGRPCPHLRESTARAFLS